MPKPLKIQIWYAHSRIFRRCIIILLLFLVPIAFLQHLLGGIVDAYYNVKNDIRDIFGDWNR